MKTKQFVRISLVISIIALAMLLLTFQGQAAVSTVQASFINVGQGDAILLRDGNGFDVLIDGGDTGKGQIVLDYMKTQGVDDIDVMVSTHPDKDHVAGLIEVLNGADIPVRAVVYNGYPGISDNWDKFTTAVANEGLVLTPAKYPDTFTWGDMMVNVLNPVTGMTGTDTNNKSVVLLVKHGNVEFLFPGDIDSSQEVKVMAHGTPVAADILKVAHHGSKYSSSTAFLAAVAPTDAVISVGKNSDGHPGAETLNRLMEIGANIWRTDLNRTIVVFSDGFTYTIHGTWSLYMPLVLNQAATVIPSITPTPTATSDLQITTLSGTTAPEYVIIQNYGSAAQNMSGWTLVSVVGPQTFPFPDGYVLDPGATVRIESYNGATNNPPAVLLWNNSPIWSNAGDKAELRDAGNGLVHSMCYGSGCS